MTSATPRVIKAAHCAAIRTPASRTNSTTIGIRATSAESARLFATGSYTCWYIRSYLLDHPTDIHAASPTQKPPDLPPFRPTQYPTIWHPAHSGASSRAKGGEAEVLFDRFLARSPSTVFSTSLALMKPLKRFRDSSHETLKKVPHSTNRERRRAVGVG